MNGWIDERMIDLSVLLDSIQWDSFKEFPAFNYCIVIAGYWILIGIDIFGMTDVAQAVALMACLRQSTKEEQTSFTLAAKSRWNSIRSGRKKSNKIQD